VASGESAADHAAIAEAAAVLRRGGLVAFPTETVYGLGGRADSARALRRIYEAKGRPVDRALILHLRSAAQAPAFVRRWSVAAERLAARFWPGPLTIVLERSDEVLDEVTGGGATVAVRVPAHPVALALLDACGLPIAAPSANRTGQPPPRSGRAAFDALRGRISLVLDAGPLAELGGGAEGRARLGSTIVDLTEEPAIVRRVGALPPELVAAVVPLRPWEPR
jgi:L-threonylcarbamoyladenylate synthase